MLAVTFRLIPGPRSGRIRYPELATELGIAAGERVPLGEARSAVLKLRPRKGMALDALAIRTPAAPGRSSPTRSS